MAAKRFGKIGDFEQSKEKYGCDCTDFVAIAKERERQSSIPDMSYQITEIK